RAMDWSLVGDVGATNARFALLKPGGDLTPARSYLCDAYPTIGDALTAYLATSDGGAASRAVLAIAAAPAGDVVRMTNHPWSFSVAELRARLWLDSPMVIKQLSAQRP